MKLKNEEISNIIKVLSETDKERIEKLIDFLNESTEEEKKALFDTIGVVGEELTKEQGIAITLFLDKKKSIEQ